MYILLKSSKYKFVVPKVSFETFTLNCCVPEALSKVVLGAFSTTMTTVTNNRDDNLAILLIISKNAFESIAQVVEFLMISYFRLKNAWLHLRSRHPLICESSRVIETKGARLRLKVVWFFRNGH